jgi:hypothetical protein
MLVFLCEYTPHLTSKQCYFNCDSMFHDSERTKKEEKDTAWHMYRPIRETCHVVFQIRNWTANIGHYC